MDHAAAFLLPATAKVFQQRFAVAFERGEVCLTGCADLLNQGGAHQSSPVSSSGVHILGGRKPACSQTSSISFLAAREELMLAQRHSAGFAHNPINETHCSLRYGKVVNDRPTGKEQCGEEFYTASRVVCHGCFERF